MKIGQFVTGVISILLSVGVSIIGSPISTAQLANDTDASDSDTMKFVGTVDLECSLSERSTNIHKGIGLHDEGDNNDNHYENRNKLLIPVSSSTENVFSFDCNSDEILIDVDLTTLNGPGLRLLRKLSLLTHEISVQSNVEGFLLAPTPANTPGQVFKDTTLPDPNGDVVILVSSEFVFKGHRRRFNLLKKLLRNLFTADFSVTATPQ